MSVPSTDLKHKYEGTGSQTEWPFTFKVFDKTQLLVKKIVGSGEAPLVLDTDYTVSGAGSDTGGGTVTYPIVGAALAVGEYIVIKPNFEFSQDLVLRNQNTFPPKPVEYAFDKVIMLLKQLKESLDRSLQVPDAYDGDADSFITLITSTSSEILASMSGTSTTSLAIGTGSKTFVTQSGKTWSVGQRLRAVSDDATKLMEGEVTAYSGTSLTLDVDYTEGAGAHAEWNISLTGARGASGAGSGDVVGANNGSDFASAATTFSNLKQAATESVTGVSRIATLAETLAGVVTNAFVAPVNLIPAIIENRGLVLLDTKTASASASLSFTTNGTYDHYIFEVIDLVPATNNTEIWVTLNADTGATKYKWLNIRNYGGASTTIPSNDTGDPKIRLNDLTGNGANDSCCGKFEVLNANSSRYKLTNSEIRNYYTTGNEIYAWRGDGIYLDTSAVTSVQFKMSSGNITSGVIRMYGIKK